MAPCTGSFCTQPWRLDHLVPGSPQPPPNQTSSRTSSSRFRWFGNVSECTDSFDYACSTTSWIRSSSKRDSRVYQNSCRLLSIGKRPSSMPRNQFVVNPSLDASPCQDLLNDAESRAAGLQEQLKAEKKLQADAESAVVSLEESASTTAEKLRALTASHEKERTLLLKRAVEAENKLKPLSDELAKLKRHLNHITQAIFGNRTVNLGQEPLVKLKAMYTFLEQLYAGSLFTIMSVMRHKEPPKYIRDVLNQLSTMPKYIEELKKLAAQAASMLSLSRAKAYVPDMDLSELAGGFPEFKMDGSEFTSEDYSSCLKETRVMASQIVEEVDLKRYQAAYTEDNQRVTPPIFEPVDLTPARRKHIFAPDVDPSIIMGEDAKFQALTTLNWDFENLQIRGRAEPEQDDPETQTAKKQQERSYGS